jgi:hypothetical protein
MDCCGTDIVAKGKSIPGIHMHDSIKNPSYVTGR